MIGRIKNGLKRIQEIGIIRIFSANLINKIVAFVVNILIVRVLTTNEYGIYSSANNTYSIFTLLIGLGTLSGVLLYGSEKREESQKIQYYKYSLIISLAFNLILSVAMLLYSLFRKTGVVESNPYIRLLCLLPIFDYINSFFNTILRCNKDNKHYSIMLNVGTISNSLFTLLGGLIYGVFGAIIGRYVSVLISCFVGSLFVKDTLLKFDTKLELTQKDRKGFLYYSIGMGFSAAIATALYLVDVYLVDYLIQDSVTLARYKVATLIPDSLGFVPLSVIIAVLPYFAENNRNYEWVFEKFKKVFMTNFILNACISLGLILFAPFIVVSFWGKDYYESILPFRILCVSFFFLGTFRILSSNLLSVFRKVKENVIISIVSIICDICLDIIMIPKYGAKGAALATLFVSVAASIISVYFLMRSLKNLKEGKIKFVD